MNYNHLFYFRTLAEHENYRKAAQELHITQPSLSNAIHNLEADLGVQLFEKKGRGIKLTVQGMRYLEYVNRAVHELNEGELMLSYDSAAFDLFLRLGYILPVAYDCVPAWLSGFQKKCRKNVFFSCINDTSAALVQELLNGNADLIMCSQISDPRVEFTPLFSRDLILLTPANHRLANKTGVDINDLEGESFIAHNRNTAFHHIMAETYLRDSLHVRVIGEADEDRAILGMVKAGMGVAVTVESPEIHGTGFCAIPVRRTSFKGTICIGRRANEQLPPAAEEFYQYVLSSVQDSSHN